MESLKQAAGKCTPVRVDRYQAKSDEWSFVAWMKKFAVEMPKLAVPIERDSGSVFLEAMWRM